MSHESHEAAARPLVVRFALLTLSDTRTIETDTSGQTAVQMIESAGHVVAARALIRDDIAALNAILDRWLADGSIDAIVTTGGTGISSRDQTIDTLERRLQKVLPGFGELFRALSYKEIGPAAMLSRAAAGVTTRATTEVASGESAGTAAGIFLVALPGSTAAVTLALRDLILPQVKHIVAELRK